MSRESKLQLVDLRKVPIGTCLTRPMSIAMATTGVRPVQLAIYLGNIIVDNPCVCAIYDEAEDKFGISIMWPVHAINNSLIWVKSNAAIYLVHQQVIVYNNKCYSMRQSDGHFYPRGAHG